MAATPPAEDLELERRALAILAEALDLPATGRVAFVREECGPRARLCARVGELLRHAERDRDPIDLTRVPNLRAVLDDVVVERRIGDFEIRGCLGTGGMGWVFEAEQGNPPSSFAVKVLAPHALGEGSSERFRRETECLGRLQHRGIARIYKADVEETARGKRPYIAMELVRGPRLRELLRDAPPPRAERLRIFVEVCLAVHHAHQKGIVHCDLKPENVLLDEEGQPKVVDFGIARALGSGARMGEPLRGTPGYVSPEQARGALEDVDAQSDVWALGALLHELLVGHAPFREHDAPAAEVLRRVREETASPLGTQDPSLRGDLEAIVARALAPAKEERYGSAAELAQDVERHLRHEPVLARRATLGYVLGKLARRHTGLVAGLSAAAVVGAVGLLTTVFWLRRALDSNVRLRQAVEETSLAHGRARAEADKARAINASFGEILSAANPYERGRGVTVAELLDEAVREIDTSLAERQEVASFLRTSLGMAYRSLGLYGPAEAALRAGYEGNLELLGPDHEETARSREELALLLAERGELAQAEDMLRINVELHRRLFGAEHRSTLRSMGNLARTLTDRGDLGAALELGQSLLSQQESVLPAGDPDLDVTLSLLGEIHYLRLELDLAEGIYRELVLRNEARYGPLHATTLLAKSGLSAVLLDRGAWEEAEELGTSILAEVRAAFGEEHVEYLVALQNLGNVIHRRGDLEAAETILREAIGGLERILGREHPRTLVARQVLASVLMKAGRLEEAQALLARLLEDQRQLLGDRHPDYGITLGQLAAIDIRKDRLPEYVAKMEELLVLQRSTLGPSHPETLQTVDSIAEARRRLAAPRSPAH